MPQSDTETLQDLDLDFPSLWGVKFFNDDYTPMDFVMAVLIQIFKQSPEDAEAFTVEVHTKGSAVLGAYPRDIAETKVLQTLNAANNHGHPLRVAPVEV